MKNEIRGGERYKRDLYLDVLFFWAFEKAEGDLTTIQVHGSHKKLYAQLLLEKKS